MLEAIAAAVDVLDPDLQERFADEVRTEVGAGLGAWPLVRGAEKMLRGE